MKFLVLVASSFDGHELPVTADQAAAQCHLVKVDELSCGDKKNYLFSALAKQLFG